MARYTVNELKVPLNPNQSIKLNDASVTHSAAEAAHVACSAL